MNITHFFEFFQKLQMVHKYGIGSIENNTFGGVFKDYPVYNKIS